MCVTAPIAVLILKVLKLWIKNNQIGCHRFVGHNWLLGSHLKPVRPLIVGTIGIIYQFVTNIDKEMEHVPLNFERESVKTEQEPRPCGNIRNQLEINWKCVIKQLIFRHGINVIALIFHSHAWRQHLVLPYWVSGFWKSIEVGFLFSFVRVSVYVIQVSRWARLWIHVQLLHIPAVVDVGSKVKVSKRPNLFSPLFPTSVKTWVDWKSSVLATGERPLRWHCMLMTLFLCLLCERVGAGNKDRCFPCFLFFLFCGPVSDETINLTSYRCFMNHRADVTSFVRLRLCGLYLTVSTIWLQWHVAASIWIIRLQTLCLPIKESNWKASFP